MIENLQKKLHQGKRKQPKGAKVCASNRYKLDCEKCCKTFCKIFGRQNGNNTKHFINPEDIFNPHMHKMGPQGPKHYIFGDLFCSKRGLRFHVFLHFNARNRMVLSFYLNWTEFTRNCQIVPIQFGSSETHNWNKIHNLLWIRSTSGKMMMSCFLTQNRRNAWNLSFLALFE